MPDNFWMGIWLVTWVISIYLCIVAYLRTRDLERRMKKIQREYDYSRIIGEGEDKVSEDGFQSIR